MIMHLSLFALVAVDGTKFRANNSKRNNFNQKKIDRHLKYIDEKITEYMKALEESDTQAASERKPSADEIKKRIEELKNRKEKYESYQEQLKTSGENELSTTDKDSRLMANNNNGIEVSYNVQTAVDDKNNLIVDFEIINNASDQGQLKVKWR